MEDTKEPGPEYLYETKIAAIVARSLCLHTKNKWRDIAPLLKALGCRHIDSAAGVTKWYIAEVDQPDPQFESLVSTTLFQALRWHVDAKTRAKDDGSYHDENVGLLDGLYQNGRWKACMASTEDCYAFSALLIGVITEISGDDLDEDYKITVLEMCCPVVIDVLNTWLKPRSPYTNMPSTAQVSRALFGEVWYDLVTAGNNDDTLVPHLILSVRPPFCTGLLPMQRLEPGNQLPHLE